MNCWASVRPPQDTPIAFGRSPGSRATAPPVWPAAGKSVGHAGRRGKRLTPGTSNATHLQFRRAPDQRVRSTQAGAHAAAEDQQRSAFLLRPTGDGLCRGRRWSGATKAGACLSPYEQPRALAIGGAWLASASQSFRSGWRGFGRRRSVIAPAAVLGWSFSSFTLGIGAVVSWSDRSLCPGWRGAGNPAELFGQPLLPVQTTTASACFVGPASVASSALAASDYPQARLGLPRWLRSVPGFGIAVGEGYKLVYPCHPAAWPISNTPVG